MSQRIIRRIKNPQNEDGDRQKKLNRRSKLFYVTCDYIEVNTNQNESGDSASPPHTPTSEDGQNIETDKNVDREKTKSGLIINVQSEPVNLFVDGNSDAAARERKKRNRKSKLFYVSCDEINVNSILDDSQVKTRSKPFRGNRDLGLFCMYRD